MAAIRLLDPIVKLGDGFEARIFHMAVGVRSKKIYAGSNLWRARRSSRQSSRRMAKKSIRDVLARLWDEGAPTAGQESGLLRERRVSLRPKASANGQPPPPTVEWRSTNSLFDRGGCGASAKECDGDRHESDSRRSQGLQCPRTSLFLCFGCETLQKYDMTNIYSVQATAHTILFRTGIAAPHFVGLLSM